jgi:hypothetical protein
MYGYVDVTKMATRVESLLAEQRPLETIEAEITTLSSMVRTIIGAATPPVTNAPAKEPA